MIVSPCRVNLLHPSCGHSLIVSPLNLPCVTNWAPYRIYVPSVYSGCGLFRDSICLSIHLSIFTLASSRIERLRKELGLDGVRALWWVWKTHVSNPTFASVRHPLVQLVVVVRNQQNKQSEKKSALSSPSLTAHGQPTEETSVTYTSSSSCIFIVSPALFLS